MGLYEDMELFACIAETGSITKAAKRIGLTKSSVSQRLKKLEQNLGFQLLHRNTRNSSLTDMGYRYLEQTKRIRQAVLEACDYSNDSPLSGTLRISTPLVYGHMLFSDLILQFSQMHPNLKIELNFSNSDTSIDYKETDLYFRFSKLLEEHESFHFLTSVHYRMCCSPEFALLKDPPRSIEDLEGYNFVHWEDVNNMTLLSKGGNRIPNEIKLSCQLTTNDGDFLLKTILSGYAMGLIPEIVRQRKVYQNRLVSIIPELTWELHNVYLVYDQSSVNAANISAISSFLKRNFHQ